MVSYLLSYLYKIAVTSVVIFIFFNGCLTIAIYQFFVTTIYHANAVERQIHLNRSKKSFIVLLVTILCLVAPSYVSITTENASIPKGTFRKDSSLQRIVSSLKRNSVIICNHQLYTDWIFLWWIAYTSRLAGNVIIMLKKSLESIPVLGYGMKNYNFIFMNRKWELDKVNLTNTLQDLDMDSRGIGKLSGNVPSNFTPEGIEEFSIPKSESGDGQMKWPYALILFPEGTNMSKNTRLRSDQYGAKVNRKPFSNVLLPRVTGLKFVLQKLVPSCECLYDVTLGYSGVTKGTYGEEIYNLRNVFLRGKAPKLVSIHLRAFQLSEIPYNDSEQFEKWVFDVWEEKDKLLDRYYKKGSFDLDSELNHTVTGLCQIAPLEVAAILVVPLIVSMLTSAMLTKLALLYFGRNNKTYSNYL
ncbi:putative acyltransferase Ecym_4505 [Eremothecium cymbalariae DBVPG|uniref:Phospholipid/glycerol acyltransferase domain-containing protein n=1 Tax=Eremothecium cymbalariae (strain CBS 270.75 / DBVPG 7215 / KCTC 17166 / NRRL Y-17582) TaxID=931890 RepID=G8JU39_ERECY|nr:hypothetical protein Ecym_4505 [Eremothecium cymbalariae DBVPG\